jgi:hypothetical protein
LTRVTCDCTRSNGPYAKCTCQPLSTRRKPEFRAEAKALKERNETRVTCDCTRSNGPYATCTCEPLPAPTKQECPADTEKLGQPQAWRGLENERA